MSRTTSTEDYLKAIYKLESSSGNKGVSTSKLAEEMEVANASVTNMVKRLAEMGLVHYESYYGTRLTDAGRKIALEMIRHHRLLELYLTEMLGYSWDEVHEEAEKLEHHISEQFEDKIAELLDNPKFDPHGDPIPTKDGKMPELLLIPVSEIEDDDTHILRRVKNQDPEFLRYLEKLGLIPGVKIRVLNKEPFEGPVEIELEGEKLSIGYNIAKELYAFSMV